MSLNVCSSLCFKVGRTQLKKVMSWTSEHQPEYLKQNVMAVNVCSRCQATNWIKAHPHSPDEAEFSGVKLLINNT